ncbi:hypothetical protein ACLKA6_014236 [Drosophila palustris]
MPHASGDHADKAAITQLQSEMQQLKEMMKQLINQQAASTSTGASTSTAAIEQAAVGNTLDAANESIQVSQFNTSTRQASVKEIAKTLPEFDPSDTNAISVEQFIDRVDNLRGPAKMWFDSSPVLHTSWRAFANALRDEFGTTPDEAEIHYAMTNAIRRKNPRCGKCKKFHGSNESCKPPEANVRRLGAENRDKWFTKEIVVQSKPYNAFIDTGSQASIVRKSVAEGINADRRKCPIQMKGICGGTRVLDEAIIVDIAIDDMTTTAQVYIAEDELLQEDFLLGQDVIVNTHFTLKFEHGQMIFDNNRVLQSLISKTNEFSKFLHNVENDDDKAKLSNLLETYADVFSTGLEGIGKTSIVEAKICIEEGKVVSQAPYRIPEPKREIVSRMIDELLQRDIISMSTSDHSFDEMHEKLGRILEVLRNCGLTLNIEKCEFFKQTITFLGHQIHPEGISPGEIKTNAIALFPTPNNVTEEDAHELDTASLKIGKLIIDEADWLFAIQLQDKKIQEIVSNMKSQQKTENDEYVIEQGRLYRKHESKLLWVVPKQLRYHILHESHDKAAFTSKEFEKFCRENNVKRILNAVRTPRANGHVERTNRIILSMLLPMTDNEKRWDEKLRDIQWSINTMVNKTTKCSPFQLLYGYEPRDVLQNTLVNVLQDKEADMMTDAELQKLREDAAARINDQRAEAKKRYDAKHSKPTIYETGDLVLVENEPYSTGTSRKLEPHYKGPFLVSKVLPHDRYLIEDIPHAQRTQRHYKSVYASDKIKPWCKIPPEDPDEEDDQDDDDYDESREGASNCQEAEL